MIMIPKKELEAIHESDLKEILESLNLSSDFNAGKSHCDICHDSISESNLGALISKNGNIYFSCSKLTCLSEFSDK